MRDLIQGQSSQSMVFGWNRVTRALQPDSFAIDSSVVLTRLRRRTSAMSSRKIRAKHKDAFITHCSLPSLA